jgi:hypothetical protein
MANLVDNETNEELTPEQIAAKALEPVEFLTEFNPNISSDLDVVARYMNKDALIAARKPEALWDKMREDWRGEAVAELIKAKAKIINDYMDKKDRDREAQNAYIQHLVSTGMSYTDARKKATGK